AGAAGILEPEDIVQMQTQLTRIAVDAAWRSRLRAAGLVRAQAFDWQAAAATTLGVYARAAARFAPSALPASTLTPPTFSTTTHETR
ncbi:MAG: hypothetical protein NTV51_01075, partial [Verrucomicrobia bacterium]|nr:hypothetical protein [Verrucomicrobiota bacterium]